MNTQIETSEHGRQVEEHELETRYDDMLNEIYGVVSVAGYEYETARLLKDVDPIAYRCGFNDWLDSEIGETLVEIDGNYFERE